MRAAHDYYNQGIAIERWRRAEVEHYWAERGGYLDQLEKLHNLRERARTLPKGDEARALHGQADELERDLWKKQRQAELDATSTPEARRRRERASELRAEAKARGEKLSPAQLTQLLDADPTCMSPRDRMRAEIVAEYERAGKRVSAKALHGRLREAGFAAPTEHIEDEAKRRDYEAYQTSGISYQSRAIVAQRRDMAIASSGSKPPRFRRWDGSGAIGVSFTRADDVRYGDLLGGKNLWARLAPRHESPRLAPPNTLSWSELIARGWRRELIIAHASRRADRELANIERLEAELGIRSRVQSVPRPTYSAHGGPKEARAARRLVLSLRIGTTERREPIWVEVPIELQAEPIPLDARIAAIKVFVTRVGLHDSWHAVFCTEVDQPVRVLTAPASGVVAINSCWRRLPDGAIRVAYWVDDRGNEGSIEVPSATLSRLRRAEELESTASRHWLSAVDRGEGLREREGIIVELEGWLSSRKDLPDWLSEAARHVRKWRSPFRLQTLINEWRSRRFAGDEDIFARLLFWLERWRHLFEWSTHLDRRARAHRREHYRIVASKLAAYETVIVRGFDMAAMKRRSRSPRSEVASIEDAVRAVQMKAASGELREHVESAAYREGRLLARIEEDWLTTTCHACGVSCECDRANQLRHRCSCGAEWDQHENIARNMLAAHEQRVGDLRQSSRVRVCDRYTEAEAKPLHVRAV
jgi:hypothetical protein